MYERSERSTPRSALSFLIGGLQRTQASKPYPIIAVSGPAGAAKSSFAEFVRMTIDPSEVPLFGMPKRDDLPAFAKNNRVLCFDNLSTISAYLADDLCRLATGGGLGGRKFYTNDGEATFNA